MMKLPFLKWLRKSAKGAQAKPAVVPRFEVTADGTGAGEVLHNGTFRFRKLASQTAEHGAAPSRSSEIDIWIIPVEAMPRLARTHDILSDEERRHAAKINHALHRTRYIAVRTALRHALSHRVRNAIGSDSWKISTPPSGRPQICAEQANCSFSITHADDFSVIAIAPETTVGIDAERVDGGKLKTLPFACLSENEQKRLRAKAEDEQYYDFFRFWTLKEAYTKALGLGLFVDFDRIEFDLDSSAADAGEPNPNGAESEKYELLTLKYMEFEHLLAICLLGVAQGREHQAAKTLYVVESPRPAAQSTRTQAQHAQERETMNQSMQIIDMSNPERIELYSIEELPELLHECVEARAEEHRDQTALEIDGTAVSYGELDARADDVASFLAAQGVAAGDFVAVYQEISIELYVSLLGILKAGAAYIPVDPKRSAKDAADLARRHNARTVLTSARLAQPLREAGIESLVEVDRERKAIRQLGTDGSRRTVPEAIDKAISHIAFQSHGEIRSGGVAVTHAEAVRFAYSLAALYGIESRHRCFQDAHLAFDVALEEVWAMLSAGATVVLLSKPASVSADAFIAAKRISVFSTGPETLEALEAELPGVEVLVVGGRPCGSKLAVKWALRTGRIVSIKRAGDRFPTFSIEQESGAAWRPRMLPPHAAERSAA